MKSTNVLRIHRNIGCDSVKLHDGQSSLLDSCASIRIAIGKDSSDNTPLRICAILSGGKTFLIRNSKSKMCKFTVRIFLEKRCAFFPLYEFVYQHFPEKKKLLNFKFFLKKCNVNVVMSVILRSIVLLFSDESSVMLFHK